ncbi:MAG: GNAT family N-acetyltransferase [Anaerolineaceae bacterium]
MTSKTSYFKGKLVNLKPVNLEQMSKVYVYWHRDTVYHRLADDEPARLFTAQADEQWIQEHWNDMIMFGIHTVSDDHLIGSIEFMEFSWSSGDAWVGIGIGDKEYQGKGYGTEAMQLLLSYGFEELNLHRVSLSVFDYNTRGIRSYEKAGFKEEGRIRQYVIREGKTWDLVFMGILRSEWESGRSGG